MKNLLATILIFLSLVSISHAQRKLWTVTLPAFPTDFQISSIGTVAVRTMDKSTDPYTQCIFFINRKGIIESKFTGEYRPISFMRNVLICNNEETQGLTIFRKIKGVWKKSDVIFGDAETLPYQDSFNNRAYEGWVTVSDDYSVSLRSLR